jgi:flavin reductase (DIM6/NTAB) family NADH-FMN oxidoreductase RutF
MVTVDLATYAPRMPPTPDVISNFWAPLCAVGSHGPHGPNAQICVSVFGASIVPDRPRVLVVLSKTNFTHDLVAETGTLAVTLLSAGQLSLLEPLGLRSGRDGAKLAGLRYTLTADGDPWFPGGAGWLRCRVIDAPDFGDSTGFLCAVVERDTFEAGPMRWADARSVLDAAFLEAWAAKSAKEQAAARGAMHWIG